MKKIILLWVGLGLAHYGFAQEKITTYKHGQNGMELVARSATGMVIVSTFNAKMSLRAEIARKIYELFKAHKISDNTYITVLGKEAKVMGTCVIKTKNNLTSIEFYYDRVIWNTGLTEVLTK
ncbi:hypothetical protein [Flavobacterium sp.]|jgi:hypothetical protein|uniref:hypothetical protein n=1 Tax=Flavobacterium sp. TaxID=239 RepID=UPI002FD8E191